MVAYEFSTAVTAERTVIIPADFAQTLSVGEAVRVILLVEKNGDQNDHQEEPSTGLSSLEELVAEIKRMPRNSANMRPASGLLGQHLAELEQERDPDLDIDSWLAEWDHVEAEMKKASLANEAHELEKMKQ